MPKTTATATLSALAICISFSAHAGDPAAQQATGALVLERHFTTNALDSPRALSDRYSVLRGTLMRGWDYEGGSASLHAALESFRYDTYDFEDDRALTLGGEAKMRLSQTAELRGALSWRIADIGDDLDLGIITLGTRSTRNDVAGEAELGLDLGHGMVLALKAGGSAERWGKARFTGAEIGPAKLKADRDRLLFSGRLTRTEGGRLLGLSASALLMAVERLGEPPVALPLTEYTLRGEFQEKRGSGMELGLGLGLQWLRQGGDGPAFLRPTLEFVATGPLPGDFQLRGALTARFDHEDSDDPLASWVRRAEIELGRQMTPKLALSAGAFGELRQNLMLANQDRRCGLFLKAAYRLSDRLALTVQAQSARSRQTVFDIDKKTLDLFVALNAAI